MGCGPSAHAPRREDKATTPRCAPATTAAAVSEAYESDTSNLQGPAPAAEPPLPVPQPTVAAQAEAEAPAVPRRGPAAAEPPGPMPVPTGPSPAVEPELGAAPSPKPESTSPEHCGASLASGPAPSPKPESTSPEHCGASLASSPAPLPATTAPVVAGAGAGTAPQSSLRDLPPLIAAKFTADQARKMNASIDAEIDGIMRAGDEKEARASAALMCFRKYDRDNSGSISVAELRPLLEDLGVFLSDEQFGEYGRMLMAASDLDASGSVDENEFQAFYMRTLASEAARKTYARRVLQEVARAETEAHARRLFAAHDTDGSGAIDRSELGAMLREVVGQLAEDLRPDQWEAFVDDVLQRGDKDGSAAFDFAEFARYYERCLASEVLKLRYEQKVLLRFEEQTGELVIDFMEQRYRKRVVKGSAADNSLEFLPAS